MLVKSLQTHADRIETGTENADISRALVVYNLTSAPITGVAVFFVSMSWQRGNSLPPIIVLNSRGEQVNSEIYDLASGEDLKGRADREQLRFQLRFQVENIPAQGWRTYIAAYRSEASAIVSERLEDPEKDLQVIETLRHFGDYPMDGTF